MCPGNRWPARTSSITSSSKLRDSRIPGGLITIEVTEQAALTNLDRASASMRRLRELGCGIAIDDFGTGANSLAYLRTLPVTRIKIDGSFVRDMLTNKRSEAGSQGHHAAGARVQARHRGRVRGERGGGPAHARCWASSAARATCSASPSRSSWRSKSWARKNAPR